MGGCVSASFSSPSACPQFALLPTNNLRTHFNTSPGIAPLSGFKIQSQTHNISCFPRAVVGFRAFTMSWEAVRARPVMLGRARTSTEARLWDDMDPRGRLLAERYLLDPYVSELRHCRYCLYFFLSLCAWLFRFVEERMVVEWKVGKGKLGAGRA